MKQTLILLLTLTFVSCASEEAQRLIQNSTTGSSAPQNTGSSTATPSSDAKQELIQGTSTHAPTQPPAAPPKEDPFDKEALAWSAFNTKTIDHVLETQFFLEYNVIGSNVADNLITARQYLKRYESNFPGKSYSVTGQMRLMNIAGKACMESNVGAIKSGDSQQLAILLLNRKLDDMELKKIEDALNSVAFTASEKDLARCIVISSLPETMSQVQ